MIKTLVKVSNITNLSDARYCAGMGVEMLGFSMDEIAPEKFHEICAWVAGVQIVGETNSDDIAEIKEKIVSYKPAILQLTNPECLVSAAMLGLPVLLSIDFSSYSLAELEQIMKKNKRYVQHFLLENSDDFAHLDAETLHQLNVLSNNYAIVLSFGLTEMNIIQTLNDLPLKGIALKGSEEIRPGFKDFDELMNILEVLEQDS